MRSLLLGIALCGAFSTFAQLNMTQIGQLDYQALHGSDISDVWGYTDELGNEYALVGVNDGGVSVVSLADPTDPEEVFFYPGNGSIWRDLKVWNDHAYVTTEGGGGLAIVDLGPLPQNTNLTAISWFGDNWEAAHNLFIDENGIAYIFGADRGEGGVIFLDLTQDPMAPVEVGVFDTWYVHDGMARGDTLYAAHISDGFFSIVDVSNKSLPVLLGTQPTGNDFTHNCWVSGDGDHLFTTDEVSSGYLGSYDISDPTDIQELQLIRSDPGSGTIPHNTHFLNDYIVTSYYTYGTTIHDVSRPWNVIETGHYDHSVNFSGGGFNGGWGTYPYLPSGMIISTDIEEGLIVLAPQYTRACWLEGLITNALTTAPINGASLTILGPPVQTASSFDGTYATGYHTAGSYDVMVEAFGYETDTIFGVVLQNGVLTTLDVPLQPLVPIQVLGSVVTSITSAPVPNAIISVEGNDVTFVVSADANGMFDLGNIFEGTYMVTVGAWGWVTDCFQLVIEANMPVQTFALDAGYADDMALDLGWTATANAASGLWERVDPVGTNFNGVESNPENDVSGDCGGFAYITGNGGGGAGNDDVDDGSTTLVSPVFDATSVVDPFVHYYRWFFNEGGMGTPNDTLRISLSNGIDTVVVEEVRSNDPNMSSWKLTMVHIMDHLTPTATMRMHVDVADRDPGHLVEAGIDRFELVGTPISIGIDEGGDTNGISIWPVPTNGVVYVQVPAGAAGMIEVVDVRGALVLRERTSGAKHVLDLNATKGMYAVRLVLDEGSVFVGKLIVE